MKRRQFVQAVIAAPAATALVAQQQQVTQQPGPAQPAPGIPQNSTQPIQPPARAASMDLPKLEATVPDAAATMMPRYFTEAEFAALQKLSDLLMPAAGGKAGASDAKAAEFLDFLISESAQDRQQIYRKGLDALNGQSQKRFSKAFAALDASQADALLASLREPWTPDPPSDPLARFLRVAKQDVRTATTNSREYATTARASAGRRAFAGGGLYWYPLD